MGIKGKKHKGRWYVLVDFHGQRKAKKVGNREASEKVKLDIEARLALGDLGIIRNGVVPCADIAVSALTEPFV
jgi:hypothetical protein